MNCNGIGDCGELRLDTFFFHNYNGFRPDVVPCGFKDIMGVATDKQDADWIHPYIRKPDGSIVYGRDYTRMVDHYLELSVTFRYNVGAYLYPGCDVGTPLEHYQNMYDARLSCTYDHYGVSPYYLMGKNCDTSQPYINSCCFGRDINSNFIVPADVYLEEPGSVYMGPYQRYTSFVLYMINALRPSTATRDNYRLPTGALIHTTNVGGFKIFKARSLCQPVGTGTGHSRKEYYAKGAYRLKLKNTDTLYTVIGANARNMLYFRKDASNVETRLSDDELEARENFDIKYLRHKAGETGVTEGMVNTLKVISKVVGGTDVYFPQYDVQPDSEPEYECVRHDGDTEYSTYGSASSFEPVYKPFDTPVYPWVLSKVLVFNNEEDRHTYLQTAEVSLIKHTYTSENYDFIPVCFRDLKLKEILTQYIHSSKYFKFCDPSSPPAEGSLDATYVYPRACTPPGYKYTTSTGEHTVSVDEFGIPPFSAGSNWTPRMTMGMNVMPEEPYVLRRLGAASLLPSNSPAYIGLWFCGFTACPGGYKGVTTPESFFYGIALSYIYYIQTDVSQPMRVNHRTWSDPSLSIQAVDNQEWAYNCISDFALCLSVVKDKETKQQIEYGDSSCVSKNWSASYTVKFTINKYTGEISQKTEGLLPEKNATNGLGKDMPWGFVLPKYNPNSATAKHIAYVYVNRILKKMRENAYYSEVITDDSIVRKDRFMAENITWSNQTIHFDVRHSVAQMLASPKGVVAADGYVLPVDPKVPANGDIFRYFPTLGEPGCFLSGSTESKPQPTYQPHPDPLYQPIFDVTDVEVVYSNKYSVEQYKADCKALWEFTDSQDFLTQFRNLKKQYAQLKKPITKLWCVYSDEGNPTLIIPKFTDPDDPYGEGDVETQSSGVKADGHHVTDRDYFHYFKYPENDITGVWLDKSLHVPGYAEVLRRLKIMAQSYATKNAVVYADLGVVNAGDVIEDNHLAGYMFCTKYSSACANFVIANRSAESEMKKYIDGTILDFYSGCILNTKSTSVDTPDSVKSVDLIDPEMKGTDPHTIKTCAKIHWPGCKILDAATYRKRRDVLTGYEVVVFWPPTNKDLTHKAQPAPIRTWVDGSGNIEAGSGRIPVWDTVTRIYKGDTSRFTINGYKVFIPRSADAWFPSMPASILDLSNYYSKLLVEDNTVTPDINKYAKPVKLCEGHNGASANQMKNFRCRGQESLTVTDVFGYCCCSEGNNINPDTGALLPVITNDLYVDTFGFTIYSENAISENEIAGVADDNAGGYAGGCNKDAKVVSWGVIPGRMQTRSLFTDKDVTYKKDGKDQNIPLTDSEYPVREPNLDYYIDTSTEPLCVCPPANETWDNMQKDTYKVNTDDKYSAFGFLRRASIGNTTKHTIHAEQSILSKIIRTDPVPVTANYFVRDLLCYPIFTHPEHYDFTNPQAYYHTGAVSALASAKDGTIAYNISLAAPNAAVFNAEAPDSDRSLRLNAWDYADDDSYKTVPTITGSAIVTWTNSDVDEWLYWGSMAIRSKIIHAYEKVGHNAAAVFNEDAFQISEKTRNIFKDDPDGTSFSANDIVFYGRKILVVVLKQGEVDPAEHIIRFTDNQSPAMKIRSLLIDPTTTADTLSYDQGELKIEQTNKRLLVTYMHDIPWNEQGNGVLRYITTTKATTVKPYIYRQPVDQSVLDIVINYTHTTNVVISAGVWLWGHVKTKDVALYELYKVEPDDLVLKDSNNDVCSFTLERVIPQDSGDYYIKVTTEGGSTLSRIMKLVVDVPDAAPTDIVLSSTSIAEGKGTDSIVGTFSAADVNITDVFRYSLVSGAGATDNAKFRIDGRALRVMAALYTYNKATFNIRVRVTDRADLFFEKEFVITSIKEAPTDILLTKSTVLEDAAIGTLVGKFIAVDVGAIYTYYFSFVSGKGSEDNNAFNIISDELHTNVELNFVRKKNYSIRVKCADTDGLFYEKAFNIEVKPVEQPPYDIILEHANLPPVIKEDFTVGIFSSLDTNLNETFTYTLVSGFGDNHNSLFVITDNGALVVATERYLNFGLNGDYYIRVRSTDSTGLYFEKPIKITQKT